jgi:hypothetical protein
VIVSVIGIAFVIASLLSVARIYGSELRSMRDALFLVGMIAVFVVQLQQGLRVANHPRDGGSVQMIGVLVIVCFLIGIGRSWELVGGPEIGIGREVGKLVRPKRRDPGSD